jgi:hypothetical protein
MARLRATISLLRSLFWALLATALIMGVLPAVLNAAASR